MTLQQVAANPDAWVVPDDLMHGEDDEGAADAAGPPEPHRGLGPQGLAAFLQHATLLRDQSQGSGRSGVSLMTLHASKGMEFHTVFVTGVESRLLPLVVSPEYCVLCLA